MQVAKKEFKNFPFQTKAVSESLSILNKGEHLILNSPPSSGKTVMAAQIMHAIAEITGKKIIFFVHLEDLFLSTIAALQMFFKPGEYQGVVNNFYPSAKVYICMSQTFASRLKNKDWAKYLNPDFLGMCVFDEAHRGEHNHILKYLVEQAPTISRVGLSGTPKKAQNDPMPLALCYDHIVNTVSEIELINMERTVPPWLIIPEKTAKKLRDGVRKKGDDFDESEAAKAFMNDRKLCSDYIELWKKHCENTETLVFCCNIEHAIHTCENFEKNGIKAKFFTGKPAYPKKPEKDFDESDIEAQVKYLKDLDKYERHLSKYNAFCEAEKKGYIGHKAAVLAGWGRSFHVLINVGVFTTGFDRDTIKTVMLLRMTVSENLYLQMVGRGKRYLKGKEFYYLLDLGGNVETFGAPTISRNYPLHVSKKEKGGGDMPLKTCPQCGQSVPAVALICETPTFENMKFTGICGHSFRKERPEYQTSFSVIQWGKLDAMNGFQAGEFLAQNKKTQVGDIYEYWFKRWADSKEKQAVWYASDRSKPEPKIFSEIWLFRAIHRKFGVMGLVELAESLNKNPDSLLEMVQKSTDLDVLSEYKQTILEKV